MKTQSIVKLLILLVITGGLWSCNSDSDDDFSVYADVVALKRKVNGETKYGVACYAYGTGTMTSGTVSTPGGSSITLESGGSSSWTYYFEPDTIDYTASYPTTGDYDFTIVNDEVEYYDSDALTASSLEIPTVYSDSLEIDVANDALTVIWKNNDDADAYSVRIYDENRESVFASYLLASGTYGLICCSSTGTFAESLNEGDAYSVEVQAVAFESGITSSSSNYYYNINAIASGALSFVWEEE